MKSSLKGACLSGLVFPGLGQIVLKNYRRGIALMLTVIVSLVIIIVKAVQQAFTIIEKIESEGGALDLVTILNIAQKVSTPSDSLTYNLLFLLIIFCWLFGIVDAYRIGKKKDNT